LFYRSKNVPADRFAQATIP